MNTKEKNMIENLENEIWKVIPNYDNRYQVSNKGRLKRILPNGTETLVSQSEDHSKYKKVSLSKIIDGEIKQKSLLVHRIVGFGFVDGYFSGAEINHKDGNKANNCAENLEWVTRSQNMLHAAKMGLQNNYTGARKYLFCQFDKKGNLIRRWGTIQDCAYVLSLQGFGDEHTIASNICACLNNRSKSCCGFYFGFEDHIDVESKKHADSVSVLAFPLSGKMGARQIVGEPIRFMCVKDTEGYTMPNGKKAIATIVCKCCKGKRDSHAGYKWIYEKDWTGSVEDVSSRLDKKPSIYQYTIQGEFVKEWTCGPMGIAEELGFAAYSGIIRCVQDKDFKRIGYGYKWSYELK